MDDIRVLITLPFPDSLIEELRAVSSRLTVHVCPVRAAGEIPPGLLKDIEILYTLPSLPKPELVPKLRWIQFHFAGLDAVADHPLVQSNIAITTSSGTAASQISEFALMLMLSLGHGIPRIYEDRVARFWSEDYFDKNPPVELRGSLVGIVGYGSVGRQVARLCHAYGATVVATKRNTGQIEDGGYCIPGIGDPNGTLVDRVYDVEDICNMASSCDFIVVTVPLTSRTRGLVDRRVLESMKTTAYLVDVSRGGVVDHAALVEALKHKNISGAALDVFPVEPLPQDSPLWDMPNVILSSHIAGASKYIYRRTMDLFIENLRRYLSGLPLLNRFDPSLGY